MKGETISFTLKNKSDLHLSRKLAHCLALLFLMLLYHFWPRGGWWVLLFLCLFIVCLEFLRLKVYPQLNTFTVWLLRRFMREKERHRPSGLLSMLLATVLIFAIFPNPIHYMSLCFMAFCDPIASFVGIRFGKKKLLGDKTFLGSFAAFLSAFGIALLFYRYHDHFSEISPSFLLGLSLTSAFCGAFSELFTLRNIDDNLSAPVLSATFLWIIHFTMGIL